MRQFEDDDEPRRFFGPAKDLGRTGEGGFPPPTVGEPLTAADAERLMGVIGQPELPTSWKQGFFFAGYRPYGLQQVEGGPCGVIAVVQAYMLRFLLEKAVSPANVLEVDETARQEALVSAICEVLFTNAGDGKKAVLMVPSSTGVAPLSIAQLRCLQPTTFTAFEQLRYYLSQRPYKDMLFSPSSCGIPLLLYSLVWTRGMEGIRERDADDPKTAAMIGAHGYCTQELVNLMVFGRAYSNVFDGTKRIGSAKDGWCVLQGAPKRPSVGFLSLFEAFKCIEVGSRYKGPQFPVWIVCAESHYTVLFASECQHDAKDANQAVDLYYFDQLARQSQDIRLSVFPNRLPSHLTTGFEENESMIDRCIRTKWKDATVDWNGSDVIL
eukprot:TRINITY_DN55369_c0_g1_i1.p1 TRINITY_DN55369_c0_g1~~TRINITY_DN55369_c0_g1_i1.p1  ORF type:complete len:381 (-),score=65.54 TRINITY_DN55369_c0_g1_i1:69-1211(-)